MKQADFWKHLPGLILGTTALALCAVINPANHYLSSLLLVVCAVGLYFYIAAVPGKRNWWDIRAVFAAIWLFTIGLAALRLTGYQRQWEQATWLILAAGYGMFYIGATLGIQLGARLHSWATGKRGIAWKGVQLSLQENRLFWICFGTTLFGIACFAANVAIRGYIPYFAKESNAYLKFYTQLYPFTVAATMISGLCYYTLSTQKQTLSLWKKIFLWFSILYSTFLFPMLVVSRGTFLTAALALTTAIFYLHKRRFWILVLCAAAIIAFYMEGTKARGYTEDQLNVFFEPSVITINGGQKEDSSTETTVTEATEAVTVPDTTVEQTENPTADKGKHFQLSGSAAFIYSYLTVSHDNFNEAVRMTEDYTYGVRQLKPFNVLLRIDALEKANDDAPYYFVRPHLNTVNLAGDAYYDFGAIGVAVMMLIWAIAFGAIQAFALKGMGPFALMALGNTMTPVTLCCFASWMGVFSHWMHWGLALLLFLLAAIKKKKSTEDSSVI